VIKMAEVIMSFRLTPEQEKKLKEAVEGVGWEYHRLGQYVLSYNILAPDPTKEGNILAGHVDEVSYGKRGYLLEIYNSCKSHPLIEIKLDWILKHCGISEVEKVGS